MRISVLIRDPVCDLLTSASFDVTSCFRLRLFVLLTLSAMVRIRSGAYVFHFQRNVTVGHHAFNENRFNFRPMTIRGCKVVSQFNYFVLIKGNENMHRLLTLQTRKIMVLPACDKRRRRVPMVNAAHATSINV